MPNSAPFSWNSIPALLLAGCFAAGIAVAALGPDLGLGGWLAAAGIGGALIGAAWHRARGRLVSLFPLLRTVGTGLVVASTGGAAYTSTEMLPPDHVAHLVRHPGAEVPVRLEGRVAGPPTATARGVRLVLAATGVLRDRDRRAVQGRVQVTLSPSRWRQTAPFPPVREGDLLRLHGRLLPVARPRNPADFDYRAYLARQGIHATLTVSDGADVAVLGRRLQGLDWAVAGARAYIERGLERHVPTDDARGVLRALVVGDRSGLTPELREAFVRTGLMHLLAVSGLHVLLVGMVLYGLLGPLLIRTGLGWRAMETTRAAATMAVLLLYMLVTGSGASAVRAVVMTGLFIGGVLLQRNTHPLNPLGAAALVLLAWRPTFLFDVGFQLSFTAVAGILLVRPSLDRLVPEGARDHAGLRWILSMTSVSLGATLGTMPVLLYHFGRLALAGLVLNLPAIPLTTMVLASGLLVVLTGGWAPALGGLFGAAADALARLLLWITSRGDAALSWAAVEGRLENGWFVAALVTVPLMLVLWEHPRLRWRCCAAGLLLAGGGLWTEIGRGAYRPHLEALFFDVGQGDAVLVTFPNRRHLLIDTGPRDGSGDAAERVLLPHLARHGIRRLDAVVITHPHSDHLGGLPSLLGSVTVHRVIHNGDNYSSALYAEAVHLIDSLGIAHRAVTAGDTLVLDHDVRVQVLSPPAGMRGGPNNGSVVLRIAYGRTTLLFTGDAEAEAEAWLVERFGSLLPSGAVKVGHHGSATSSTQRFVERVVPDASGAVAVVSVARTNLYGLPDEDVLARWIARGAELWTTAAEGAVWLRSDGTRIVRRTWRDTG